MNNLEHEMYREIVLDHYNNPRNFGELGIFTHRAEKKNTSCGDRIGMTFVIVEGKVENVKFNGEGCALSIATASLLTEYLKGRDAREVLKMSEKDLMEILNVNVGIGRVKCLLLPLETLKEALGRLAGTRGGMNKEATGVLR